MYRDIYETMTREQLIERAVDLDEKNAILEKTVRINIENEKLRDRFEVMKEGKIQSKTNLAGK